MPSLALEDFIRSFNSDIRIEAQAMEILLEHAFVEKFGDILVDYGVFDNFQPTHWQAQGYKVDGFAFDDEYENLTIIVSHFLDETDPESLHLTNSDLDKVFKRAVKFFEKSYQGLLKDRIDVSNSAQQLAELIHESKKDIVSVRVILITDGITKERHAVDDEVEGIPVQKIIWDIQRACNFIETGEREEITVDFKNDYSSPVKCVETESDCGAYSSYLAFLPGQVLADLYDKWKIQMLERNVRVFLSDRVKVNQGIRDTIREEPTLFCAYNNGITVYAKEVEMVEMPCGTSAISKVKDFQIVNGGQTTASLYHTREKHKADLSKIAVQMKLFVINDDANPEWHDGKERLSDVLLPHISRYSNTQNRIQFADLLANDPPHPELHAISLNTPAPDPTGGSVQSYWLYEKSRGLYQETRRITAKTFAQQRKFDQRYPKSQRFDKNKFGKAWNSYLVLPHVVCLGAMKNFARFNNWLRDLKDEDWTVFFKKTVALVMLWNEAERIVRRQKFGGYTHAIVSYTLSWFHNITKKRLDLDKIWADQAIDERVLEAIEILSQDVNEIIRETDKNVSEWCKNEACWNNLLEYEVPDLPDMKQAMKSGSRIYDRGPSKDEENIEFCVSKGPEAWKELSKWLKEHQFMSGKQRSQCFNMGRAIERNEKAPSKTLAYACREIWEKAQSNYGWSPESEE